LSVTHEFALQTFQVSLMKAANSKFSKQTVFCSFPPRF
jgi:hypothetical protein